jgi:quinol monooxygenase YgiN
MAIGIVARLEIQEGKSEEFEAAFAELKSAVTANEPGVNFYSLHRSRESETTYVVLEQYADQAAFDAHGATDHMKTIGAKLGACFAEAPGIELLDAV